MAKAEAQVIQVRWLGIAAGMLAGPLILHGGELLALWIVCLVAALHNLLLRHFVIPRRPQWLRHGYLSTLGDIALADAVVLFTGGLHSELYLAYFLIAVVSAIRFGGRMALIAIACVMASYIAVITADGQPLAAVTLGHVVLRIGFIAATALFVGFVADRAQKAERHLRESYDATLAALSAALDQRDAATEGHSQRVAAYAHVLGRALGLDGDDLTALSRGALLHDIGKIGVPDEILRKPGALSEEERDVIRTHPRVGARILEGIPFLRDALDVVLHHHERWDGEGYPDGQRGEAINRVARVFAIVDAYDAMTSERPYRGALTHAEAITEIRRCSGAQFDPAMVDAFCALPEEVFDMVREAGGDA